MWIKWLVCLLILGCFSIPGFTQTTSREDSLQFICPLKNAKRHIDSAALKLFGTEDIKLIISSAKDSIVVAPADGMVTSIFKLPSGLYEIVFQADDFYFWISGIQHSSLKSQEPVSAAAPLGILKPGTKLEILLFEAQNPIHPLAYLPCFPD